MASRTRWSPACEAQHVRAVGRDCWKMKTSLTPRALRRSSSFKPTSACPTPFSWSYSSSQATGSSHSHQTLQKKHNNRIFDPTDDKKGRDSQSSRKNNRPETGFFNLRFRLHKNWPRAVSNQAVKILGQILRKTPKYYYQYVRSSIYQSLWAEI